MEVMKLLTFVVCLCMGTFFLTAGVSPAIAGENIVRAKLGISVQSADRQWRAKTGERLSAGDRLRIYVYPEEDSFIYVVHTDLKSASLLKMVEKSVPAALLVLPSARECYQVDGQSPIETFTIICSPEELKEIPTLFDAGASLEKWSSLEKELAEKSVIDLGDKPDKPFAIAGNVRGLPDSGVGDSFLSELQVYSGNGLLVKHYEFTVKSK